MPPFFSVAEVRLVNIKNSHINIYVLRSPLPARVSFSRMEPQEGNLKTSDF